MKNYTLIYLLAALLLFSCDTTDSSENLGEETDEIEINHIELIPLEVGNTWVYRRHNDDIDTTFIRRDTTINNEQYFIEDTPREAAGLDFTTTYLIAYSDSGLSRARYVNNEISSSMFYRFPQEENRGYYQEGYEDKRHNWYTTIKPMETIATPFGTLETYVYYSEREDTQNNNRPNVREQIHFAEGIGIIRKKSQSWLDSCSCWYPARTNNLIEFEVADN